MPDREPISSSGIMPRTTATSVDSGRGYTSTPVLSRSGEGRTIASGPDYSPGQPPIIDSDAISRVLVNAGIPTAPEIFSRLFPAPPAPSGQSAPTDGDSLTPVSSYADKYGLGGVLADLFGRTFGASETDTPRPPIVVGDAGMTSAGGGGNLIMILLVLAVIGGAALWLFFRKKGGAG